MASSCVREKQELIDAQQVQLASKEQEVTQLQAALIDAQQQLEQVCCCFVMMCCYRRV